MSRIRSRALLLLMSASAPLLADLFSGALLAESLGGGSTSEFHRFAAEAADATKKRFGDALYTQILLGFAWEIDLTTDWPRMKRGFHDFMKRYPGATRLVAQRDWALGRTDAPPPSCGCVPKPKSQP